MTEETCVLSRDIALEFKPRLLPTAAVCYVDTPVTVALCAATVSAATAPGAAHNRVIFFANNGMMAVAVDSASCACCCLCVPGLILIGSKLFNNAIYVLRIGPF